jgi:hypothetical protein
VKLPVPVAFEVLLSAVVGFWLALQQTPREVTDAPPSEVISPPLVAVVAVILVTVATVTVGAVLMASFLQHNMIGSISPARSTG